MLYTASVRALNVLNEEVLQRQIGPSLVEDIQDEIEEFTDILERRGIRFARIVFDMSPTVKKAVDTPFRGGYIGLFPELFESSEIGAFKRAA